MPEFNKIKISTKFILWFLIISLIPLAISIFVSYTHSQNVLLKEIQNSLFAITDNKANQLEGRFQRVKNDALTIAANSVFIEAMDKLNAALKSGDRSSEGFAAVDQQYRPMFSYYCQNFGYSDLMLVSFDGKILFSTQEIKFTRSLYEVALEKRSELIDTFIRANQAQEMAISGFEYGDDPREAFLYIVVPVFKGGSPIGCIVFKISNQSMFEFVNDYAGLGATGEVILAGRVGTEPVLLAPLRFDPEAALKRKLKDSPEELLYVERGLNGENGSGMFTDYRRKEVLAVLRYLPTFKLAMVVKMDAFEVFAPAREMRDFLLWLGVILIVIVVIAASLLGKSISRPLVRLTEVSKVISQGELSERAKVTSGDEIGELAASFNHMADSLIKAKASVERKNAEVEEQKRLLESANKELDSFVYTVSHDLKGPLRGIDGFAQFLEKDYAAKMDEQGKDFIRRIRSGTNRMKQLIEDLLMLSKISRIKNPFEDVQVLQLVQSVLGRLDFDIKQHKVKLLISDKLPLLFCDKIKIEEAILNLVSNAIKYSSKNTDSPVVEIGYTELEEAHQFFVKDNGIGIDKKYHQEIFGIFKRLHNQQEYEGSGAGLSIVKKIIEDHNGSIWLDSEPGEGSTFYFTLPKEMKEKRKLGEILVKDGLITQEELKSALDKQGQQET